VTGRHRRVVPAPANDASAASTADTVDPDDAADVTFGGLFRVRDFAVLYVAGTQSQLGDQLARVALSILVFSRTGSGLATAATYALTFLPAFVGGIALSGLADSRPRRALLIVCDLLRAVLFAIMAIPGVPLPLLFVLLVAAVLAGSPYSAAEPAVVADLFTGARYQTAVGLRTATSQVTQLVGFALGGVVVALTGPELALLIDAISFVAAAALISIGLSHFPASVPRAHMWRQLRGGARTIAGNARLRVLLGLAWLTAFWIVPEGLAAPFANDHGGGATAVGLLLAANPTGSLIGTVVLTRWVRPASRSRLLGLLAVASGLPLCACAGNPPIWLAVLLWGLCGAFSSYIVIVIAEFIAIVPTQVRGQAIGLASSSLLAAQGIGLLLGGVTTAWWGPAVVIAVAGAVGSTVAAGLALVIRRERRRTSGCSAPFVVTHR
jgi:predicted MFS family arabinose efflux permease